jgi:hypothetical protein
LKKPLITQNHIRRQKDPLQKNTGIVFVSQASGVLAAIIIGISTARFFFPVVA